MHHCHNNLPLLLKHHQCKWRNIPRWSVLASLGVLMSDIFSIGKICNRMFWIENGASPHPAPILEVLLKSI